MTARLVRCAIGKVDAMQRGTPFTRRGLFASGLAAVGGGPLAAILRAAEGAGSKPRAKSCILLYMDGGPSHLDLWDLKPLAAAEIRGPFRPRTVARQLTMLPSCPFAAMLTSP